jgi:hypothetical protein
MTPLIKVGQVVMYTMEFDSDLSYSPNVGPAMVAKVHSNGNPDLVILTINGVFFKTDVPFGSPEIRASWHLLPV